MPSKKLTELTAEANPSLDDLIYLVDAPAGTPASRKATLQVVRDLIAGSLPQGQPSRSVHLNTAVPNEIRWERYADRNNGTLLGVSGTTAETTLLNPSPFVVPANGWTALTALQLVLVGAYTNNSGSDRDVTFRLRTGTTLQHVAAVTAVPASGNPRLWKWTIDAVIADFLGSKLLVLNGLFQMNAAIAAGAASGVPFASLMTTPANGVIDLTGAINVDVTAQHSNNAGTITALLTYMLIRQTEYVIAT